MAQAFDRRRINGPEESISPSFADDALGGVEKWIPEQPRRNRGPSDIRPIC